MAYFLPVICNALAYIYTLKKYAEKTARKTAVNWQQKKTETISCKCLNTKSLKAIALPSLIG